MVDMEPNPYEPPAECEPAPEEELEERRPFLTVTELLVILSILGMLTALLVPAVQKSGPHPRRKPVPDSSLESNEIPQMETPHLPNTPDSSTDAQHSRVRPIGPPEAVPVYNCVVIVSPRNAAGFVVARVATLPDVVGEGDSERQALQKIVAEFKARLIRHRASGEAIPWLDPPQTPRAGEQCRWIAVHL